MHPSNIPLISVRKGLALVVDISISIISLQSLSKFLAEFALSIKVKI